MINLKSNSKIYLMCPAAYSSGGPELLHQLSNKLNLLGFDSYMYYYPVTDFPMHPNYSIYNTKFTFTIEDEPENLIIIPEVSVVNLNQNKSKYKHIKKCIWWLSIDNFFKTVPLYHFHYKLKIEPSDYKLRFLESLFLKAHINNHNYNYHLVQSHYALNYLKKEGIESMYLSDFLNKKFIESSTITALIPKENIVLYNPKKGLNFTTKLIESCMRAGLRIEWKPLINLSQSEILELLKMAKIYIDFGPHPGKDRFPREAAISNCCVITGLKGSACFFDDVPIENQYKIENKKSNIPKIVDLIKSCLDNYDSHLQNFEYYRNCILKEEQIFVEDIKNIFNKASN